MITIKTAKSRLCFKEGQFQDIVGIPDRILVNPDYSQDGEMLVQGLFQKITQPFREATPEIPAVAEKRDGSKNVILVHAKEAVPAQPAVPAEYSTIKAVVIHIPWDKPKTEFAGMKDSHKYFMAALKENCEPGFEFEMTSTI